MTIITTEANETVAPIHDRMPVMLEPDDVERWLKVDDEAELQALLDPYPDDLLAIYPISTRINEPANDSPDVIKPIDIGEQAGLGEFS